MQRSIHQLDVFTQQPLAGNPLAVVLDGDGLSAALMQKIAREFNLSETVFVLAPRNPVNTARIRIFTPTAELPFAGHPTVGTAALIARLRAPEFAGARDLSVILEAEIGVIACTVRLEKNGVDYAYFELPKLPEKVGGASSVALAHALGLERGDIGFDNHTPTLYSAGATFCFCPVASRAALEKAAPDADLLRSATLGARGAYLYTRETVDSGNAVQARMFGTTVGLYEDPATGAAAAAFAGVAHEFEKPEDGEHTLVIEQGYAMGRPSQITLGVVIRDGALMAATIGGHVVSFGSGKIEA
ncbi:MAG: PhzF family phenazine biosynthesis protein [Hyphomicrobiales bacterium]|nr:PhzF family phenazine biosynthesis protein [Hyphomicrobiales bacterium]